MSKWNYSENEITIFIKDALKDYNSISKDEFEINDLSRFLKKYISQNYNLKKNNKNRNVNTYLKENAGGLNNIININHSIFNVNNGKYKLNIDNLNDFCLIEKNTIMEDYEIIDKI
tara:strand:- start:97 stop:444 length:348 start_codon:yes stop_codon:yes gene_type:complete